MIRRGDEGGVLSEISPLTMVLYQPELTSMAQSVKQVKGLRAGFCRGLSAQGRGTTSYNVGNGDLFWMVTRDPLRVAAFGVANGPQTLSPSRVETFGGSLSD